LIRVDFAALFEIINSFLFESHSQYRLLRAKEEIFR